MPAHWKATFVGVLVLVATIVCSAVLHVRAMQALQNEVQDKLKRVALTIASEMDGDLHRKFTDPKQESSPEYERALEPLNRALNWKIEGAWKRNDYRFVYTCLLREDGSIVFVLDPTPSNIGKDGLDEKSHIFQPYPDASESLRQTLKTGQPYADKEPYTDEWGTFVSGYAPFYDSTGKIAGAVGVDWRAETYAERLAGIRNAWYLQIVLCLISGFLSGLGTGVAMVRRERAEAARRHAIEEARRNRERWRIMVETLPRPAAHLQEGQLWVNAPLVRALGWANEELATEEAFFQRLCGAQAGEARAKIEADRAAGFATSRALQVQHHDGRVRWIEFTAHAYAPGEVWLIEDITDRHEYQAALIAAREAAEAAANAKGAFLATVSHEIRTPMNGVIGMANLMLESSLDDRQREMAEVIRNSGEALVVVINDILDFSKIESGAMELESAAFDLRACVEDCLQLFAGLAAQKGLHLNYQMPPECPAMIRGDSTRLRQILCNLIGNAVKFTERGEIEVRLTPADRITPKVGDEFSLAIDVRDTGIGIPANRLDRLFKSFSQVDASTTRKYGGTGLGLVIARRLAELMGGTITVTSEPGHGSTFHVTFTTLAEPTPPTSLLAPQDSLRGVRVLLVEPHAPTATFIETYLRQWGMDCASVPEAQQALRQVRDFSGCQLVVSAMEMPCMDGIELARIISTARAGAPKVLLLSSFLREDIVAEARAAGVAKVLTKPLRPAVLLQAISQTLGSQAAAEAAPKPPAAVLAHELPLRILVAEDNPVNQLVARRTFERHGYEIALVEDGEKAVAAARHTTYDVIFMDVHMPTMNGLEATRRIRSFPPTVGRPWIVALTATSLEADIENCRRDGMDDYLPKPMRFADLERALRKVPRG